MDKAVDSISIEHAKENKLFYCVITVIPFRESDEKVLLLKRSETEKAHPNKWAIPGGKIEWEDIDLERPDEMNGIVLDYHNTFDEVGARELFEESAQVVKGEMVFNDYKLYVRPDGIPTILLQFIAMVEEDQEVILEEGAFTDYAWVSEEEIDSYDCVKGIKEEVRLGLSKI